MRIEQPAFVQYFKIVHFYIDNQHIVGVFSYSYCTGVRFRCLTVIRMIQ